ncbi:hypothetical protein H7965_26525 [Siccirubricoccus deserti]|uniref:Acyltransferase n=1 Tax=Siccirubricoccus deserti TaxID=2013562 RepID=A0A9X0R2V3_9PROT|nr:hypothetical protein [Siccirubricoccus deserti]
MLRGAHRSLDRGRAEIGAHCWFGPHAAVGEGLTIGPNCRVGAQADVMSDVPAGAEVVGSPTQPRRKCFRQVAFLRRMGCRAP